MPSLYNQINFKSKQFNHFGDGLNSFTSPLYLKPSEASYSKNMFCEYYPEIRTRYGLYPYATPLASIYGAGSRLFNALHVLNTTIWQTWNANTSSWDNVQTGLTATRCTFIDFMTSSKNYTYFSNILQHRVWDGAAITSVTAPLTRFLAVDDYRMYAGLDFKIYWTDLSDPTNWSTGEASNLVIAGAKGSINAITKFGQDQVIAFTDKSMHVLYGDDPDNFQLLDPIYAGCLGQEAMAELDGVLYFLDNRNIKMYAGGNPVIMPNSEKIQYYLDRMYVKPNSQVYTHVMASFGKYLLLSIPYSSSTQNDMTFVYDTILQRWDMWYFGFRNFTEIQDTNNRWLIGIGTNEYIYSLFNISITQDNNETGIAWEHITGTFNFGTLSSKKVLSAIWVHFYYLLEDAETDYFKLDYMDGNGAYTNIKIFSSSSSDQIIKVDVPNNVICDSNFFKLKFYGVGQVKLKGYELEYRVKS